jgi:glycerol-3-phosphate dehydrogenase (NAD(P)+)
MNISVYGCGNFGFAILSHLCRKGYPVTAYDRDMQLISHLKATNTHLYFHKDSKIEGATFTDTLDFLADADLIVVAVTSDATKEVMTNLKKLSKKGAIVVNTAKALDIGSGKRLSQVSKEAFPKIRYAMIAGGTIASDLFSQEPLGMDIASEDTEVLDILVPIFQSDNLNVYRTSDLVGVEYASSFKNVAAIMAGIINGLGHSFGSETHLISRFSLELKAIAVSRGAQENTFSMESQCWGNDLWMSCTGNTRNRQFGVMIGKGISTQRALEEMREKHLTVEGLNTLNSLADVKGYPLLEGLKKIVLERKSPREIISGLMSSNII